jgi:hypothetical protein
MCEYLHPEVQCFDFLTSIHPVVTVAEYGKERKKGKGSYAYRRAEEIVIYSAKVS